MDDEERILKDLRYIQNNLNNLKESAELDAKYHELLKKIYTEKGRREALKEFEKIKDDLKGEIPNDVGNTKLGLHKRIDKCFKEKLKNMEKKE